MDLHSKMTMYITSTMTSPGTKTAKTSKWLRLKSPFLSALKNMRVEFLHGVENFHQGGCRLFKRGYKIRKIFA